MFIEFHLNIKEIESWPKYRAYPVEPSPRTFCHVDSREEAQYLSALWNVQPALDTEAKVAEVSIETTLKSCASTSVNATGSER